ncbi:hypothetical protein VB264_12035 [Arcicella aquatica]|uniref:UDP-N-acetylglucosamine 2-epimerase n=1 Tax=Arcicella aquatica TaxID=217141 RepID=A0ABU5QNN3_9BACT|nr:hypothetical protein [Arcicella aquatica]MEA5258515.1 hypothetical protein [Arcicella aquatica]
MKKKILFITGSINQTTQMHQIADQLPEFDCWYSQIFTDSPFIQWVIDKTEFLNKTVLAGQFKENSEKYCYEHHLQLDYKARKNQYDLVVYCSDMIIPDRMLQNKTLWVQEGMIDEYTGISKLIKTLKLPPYLAVGTSLNGSSNICDVYCAASEGYKERFSKIGTNNNKILVTGIPNFDNCEQYHINDFPLHNYVLVATSDGRECFRPEDRVGFIKDCVAKAAGRQMIFKLHPNEIVERATNEIKENTPEGTKIYTTGNINPMIANCDEFITQYSSAVYVGMALGKKVHSFFDKEELIRQMPIQNKGTSAKNIAQVCRDFLAFKGKKEDFVKSYDYKAVSELVYE